MKQNHERESSSSSFLYLFFVPELRNLLKSKHNTIYNMITGRINNFQHLISKVLIFNIQDLTHQNHWIYISSTQGEDRQILTKGIEIWERKVSKPNNKPTRKNHNIVNSTIKITWFTGYNRSKVKISKLNNNPEPMESPNSPPNRSRHFWSRHSRPLTSMANDFSLKPSLLSLIYIELMTFKVELPFVRIWRRWPRWQWTLQFGCHSRRWLGFEGDGDQIEQRHILLGRFRLTRGAWLGGARGQRRR